VPATIHDLLFPESPYSPGKKIKIFSGFVRRKKAVSLPEYRDFGDLPQGLSSRNLLQVSSRMYRTFMQQGARGCHRRSRRGEGIIRCCSIAPDTELRFNCPTDALIEPDNPQLFARG